jgi:hypothetical protein
MSSTRIHWGRILLGGLLAEVALILAIVPLGLRLGENFLHYTASPRILRHVLSGSALGGSTDRIPFHSAWDVGGSGRSADLCRLDARAARTLRIHCGPRAETRGRCMRRLRRPAASITVSGANRSRLIHCLIMNLSWRSRRRDIRHRDSPAMIVLVDRKAEPIQHARQVNETEPVALDAQRKDVYQGTTLVVPLSC